MSTVEKISAFTPTRISPADLDSRVVQGARPSSPQEVGGGFAEALRTRIESVRPQDGESLKFSAHAMDRLRSRSIQLSEADQLQLQKAVDMAGAKGARESLIVLNDLALIVSIQNRVVITAMERGAQEPNIFTQIDSAVVLP